MSTQKTPLGGRPIPRKEAFRGLGDPKTWNKFSETVYAEFRAKPKMGPAAGSLVGTAIEAVKRIYRHGARKVEVVYAHRAKRRLAKMRASRKVKPTIDITGLTTSQLRRALAIKEQIGALQSQLDSIASGRGERGMATSAKARWAKIKGTSVTAFKRAKKGKRRLSAVGRAALIAATKARWARVKGQKDTPKFAKKEDRRSSPAVRAKLAAAARARWARRKAAGRMVA